MREDLQTEIDNVLDDVTLEMSIENIKTRDNLITYLVEVYGDQWRYKKYIPIGFYLLSGVGILGMFFLVFIAINGGLSEDDITRVGFHQLWVMFSNVMYFLLFLLICSNVYSFLMSRFKIRIYYGVIVVAVFIVPLTWWMGVSIAYIFK